MAGELTARLSDVNDTELRQLLRQKGFAVPPLATREFLEAAWEGRAKPGPMTRIDWYRWVIMGWVNENWDTLYYQIECPLLEEGCTGCPDFQVVSCLVANRNAIDLTKEEVEMPGVNWPVLIMTMGSKREDAAKMLRAAAEMKLEDTKATRLALKKTTKAVFDLINNGTVKATDYLGLAEKDIPPEVTEFATKADVPAVLRMLAAYLDGEIDDGEVKDQTPAEAAPAEKKSELPPKDEEKKAEKPKAEPKSAKPGYFPGVADQKPDSLPDDNPEDTPLSDDEPQPDRFDGPGADAESKQEPLPAGQPAAMFVKEKNEQGPPDGPIGPNAGSKLPAMWKEAEVRAIVREELAACFGAMFSALHPVAKAKQMVAPPQKTEPPKETPKADSPKEEAPKSESKPESKPRGKRGGVSLPPAD
jgi:hypothetical protein